MNCDRGHWWRGSQKPEHPDWDKEGKINISLGVPPGGAAAWESEGGVEPRAGPAGPGFDSQWIGEG